MFDVGATMREVTLKLVSMLPKSIKQSLLGSRSNPSHLANTVHALLNRLPGEEMTCLPCKGVLKGFQMKIDWSRHRSFAYGDWEPDVVNAITDVVKTGAFALDIGAHIGFYTLILAKTVGIGGRVIAFEPLKLNYSVLCDNIRLNDCKHVQAVNKALMDRPCSLEADIRISEALPGSVAFRATDKPESPVASAVALDDYLAESKLPLDFMKIDVEGAESMVLKGAAKTIEFHHPTLLMEIHHFDRSSPDASPVMSQLRGWGYAVRWLNRGPDTSHLLAT